MIARITDRVFEPDDDALGQNEVPYLLKDLYTVAGLADERGWPVERYDYDAYGKVHMNRCAVLPWAADFDGDGDVDQNDLTVFLDAYGGSGQAPNGPRGWRADLDGDGDVDGSDYLLFADAYNGAENPPRPPSPTVSVGSMAITSGSMVVSRVGNPFFFTGRRLDVIDKQDAGTPHHFTDDYAGLQLYDYRARTMDPVLGRFGQRDRPRPQATDRGALGSEGEIDTDLAGSTHSPFYGSAPGATYADVTDRDWSHNFTIRVPYEDGMNLQEYAGSRPAAAVDPLGLDWIDDWILDPILTPIAGDTLLRCTGGYGHVPIVDPGTGQRVVVITCEVVSCLAPCCAAGKVITATKQGVCVYKSGAIGCKLVRIRKYIRWDFPHHNKLTRHWHWPWDLIWK